MPGLIEHPRWPDLLPLIKVQRYDRDGGHAHPRHRLEVLEPESPRLRAALLQIETLCAECDRPIHPIRERRGQHTARHTLYLAVTCEWSVRFECSRGRAAHEEYERLIAAARAYQIRVSPQPRLSGLEP